jgi:hypothetical protein
LAGLFLDLRRFRINLYQKSVISGNCLKIFLFLPIVPYGALQIEIIENTGQWQMDKKTQKESESLTERKLSTDDGAVLTKKLPNRMLKY